MVKVEGKKAVSMNINPEVWRQVCIRAAVEGKKVPQIVEESLTKQLIRKL
jgi:hypothetical protein